MRNHRHLILWDEPQYAHHESDENANEYEEGNAGFVH